MARNIKPGFFTCPELLELPFAARLLFAGLWCAADRQGRLEDRPAKIKLQVLPGDAVDIDGLLGELATAGFIERYEAEGIPCIQVVNFLKHQRPYSREKESELPCQQDTKHNLGSAKAQPRQDHDRSDTGYLIPDTGYLIPDPLNLIPDTGVTDGFASPEVEAGIRAGGGRNRFAKR